MSEALVERGIVVEKAGVNTVTLITTFQLEEAAVEATVGALEEILAGHELPDGEAKRMPANPFRAIDDRPVMHPYHARRYAKAIGQEVPLDQAVGRVAAEEVEVYPPGIPVILEGFRVSEDAVRYLREARDLGARSSRATRRWRRCGCCRRHRPRSVARAGGGAPPSAPTAAPGYREPPADGRRRVPHPPLHPRPPGPRDRGPGRERDRHASRKRAPERAAKEAVAELAPWIARRRRTLARAAEEVARTPRDRPLPRRDAHAACRSPAATRVHRRGDVLLVPAGRPGPGPGALLPPRRPRRDRPAARRRHRAAPARPTAA